MRIRALIQALTSDRYNSGSPAWSADGKWLYFLSDRMLRTVVRSPWGARQPDPYFDRSMKVYELGAYSRPALAVCASWTNCIRTNPPSRNRSRTNRSPTKRRRPSRISRPESKPGQAAEAKKAGRHRQYRLHRSGFTAE